MVLSGVTNPHLPGEIQNWPENSVCEYMFVGIYKYIGAQESGYVIKAAGC